MERRPPLALAAAVLLGACAGQPLSGDARALVLAGLALCGAAVLARTREPAPFRALAVFALVAAAADAQLHLRASPHVRESRTQRIACTVLGDVRASFGSASFRCALDDGPNVLVDANGSPPPVGAHILLRGRIEPFDEPRNPGEPSERAMARERGVTARVAPARILARLPAPRPTLAIRIAYAHAWALGELHARLGEPAATILAGELWGERGALAPDLRAEFAQTGTIHVLVTAGLHLGVVAALIALLLGAARVPRVPACALAAGAVWGYALVSGLHLPAMRAATMITFGLAARACGRSALSLDALCAAAIVLTLADPLAVTSASFALSFSCVGAIVLAARHFEQRIAAYVEVPHRLREAFAVALATQLGTWPVTAATFLYFAPYAVLANVAVVPVVGATMLLGIAQLALCAAPGLAQAAANLNGWLLEWIVACVRVAASLPGARIVMTPAPVWTIAAYDAALIAAFAAWRDGARTAAAALAIAGAVLILAPPQSFDERLRVDVLDVGQADCIVVQTPRGHVLLVDAGGRLERGPQMPGDTSAERVGERIVVPFLLRHGIHRVDAILLSHPHGDHAGGVAPVLRSLGAGAFADSGQRYRGYAYSDALAAAHTRGVPIVYPRAGAVWQTDDGVTLTFIGPSLPFIRSTNAINDNSVAFVLRYKHFRMLFTGDAGVAAERRFLAEGIDLHADVLKVGHHGSAYGSTPAFIAAVRPRYAVISVGRHNLFGHPAPATVRTLRRFGAQIYRTDENGAIAIVTDGTRTRLTPMLETAPSRFAVPDARHSRGVTGCAIRACAQSAQPGGASWRPGNARTRRAVLPHAKTLAVRVSGSPAGGPALTRTSQRYRCESGSSCTVTSSRLRA